MPHPDFVIAGAGIIGLSLALELDRRGASVVVLEAGAAMAQASSAAAGMLAVEDPANPPALAPLAHLSASLYPAFLDRLADLSSTRVPFQTTSTLESCAPSDPAALPNPRELVPALATDTLSFRLLQERSVDPRQLASTVVAALPATRIRLHEHTPLTRIAITPTAVRVSTSTDTLESPTLIDCMGAWSPAPVHPRKGQLFSVKLPPGLDLESVLRTHGTGEDIYIVPRTSGPQAGQAVIGATVEHAGFDLTVRPADILALNARAIRLLPVLTQAEFISSWAGLRPATADGLPLLGPSAAQPRFVLANGHFRNGILLAPASAHLVAQLLLGDSPDLDLSPFSPARTTL